MTRRIQHDGTPTAPHEPAEPTGTFALWYGDPETDSRLGYLRKYTSADTHTEASCRPDAEKHAKRYRVPVTLTDSSGRVAYVARPDEARPYSIDESGCTIIK